MERLLVFVFAVALLGSCSSKKILSVRKIAHNRVINNIASQYDFSQKQYSTLNISKNSSAKNLSKVKASIPTVRNNPDFLASKDKIDPSVLATNYSHIELPHFIQQEKIDKSFLEKVPILKHKENTKKKSKSKNKQNKILLILLSLVSTIASAFMLLVALFNYALGSPFIATVSLLISIIFFLLAVRSLNKAFTKVGRGRGLY